MIKLVAFDWNGTILADTNAILKADNAVLKNFGLPKTNLTELQNLFRMPIKDFWLAMGFDAKLFDAEKVASIFMKTYEPLEKTCRTRSGAKEILKWLNTNGILSVLFSNHIRPHIERQLKRLDITTYITDILARSIDDISHMHRKSKDQKLKDFVKAHRLRPREVLVVGDTDEEIDIAKKFNYYSVVLTGGNTSASRLKAAKPDFLIHNLVQIKRIINTINS